MALLYRTAPQAALADPVLHRLLALVDGRALQRGQPVASGTICRSIAWCFTGLNQARSTHDLDGAFNALGWLSGGHPYRKPCCKRESKHILTGWQRSSGALLRNALFRLVAAAPLNGCRR